MSYKALIIDDEYFNRELIRLLIKRYGSFLEVSGEADNLQDAEKLITDTDPDVVFLDLKMPDGNGFDLLKKVQGRRFKLIFITGFDEYSSRAMELSAFDYILKPIDIDVFKSSMERLKKRLVHSPGTM